MSHWILLALPGPASASPPPEVVVDRCGADSLRCFNATFYAIDTVIPYHRRTTQHLVPERTSAMDRFMTWWLNIATIAGWILSSLFVLAWPNSAATPAD
jgi:hypothetical protein